MTTDELAAEVLRESAHCPPAAELATAASRSVAVTLIVSADAAESGCVNWLQTQFPDGVRVVPADTDFTTAALAADVAVLLFPCWGVPDPTLIARWQAVLAARPEGTTHVVLDAAELMKTPEDRRSADSVVRKWLMPTEGEPTAFRWSADVATADDCEGLRAALARPLSGVQKQQLNVVRLSYAIDLLEAVQQPTTDPLPAWNDWREELSRRRAKVLGCVRDLRDRMRETVSLVFDELGNRLERRLTEFARLLGKPSLMPMLEDIVSTWREWAEQKFADRIRAEWAMIEPLMPAKSLPAPVATSSPPTDTPRRMLLGVIPTLADDLPRPAKLGVAGPLTPYLRTAGAAVVTPLVTVALGVPVLGVIGGTVVATAGVLMYDRVANERAVLADNGERLQAYFGRKISEGRAFVEGHIGETVTRLLDDCKAEFDEGEALLRQPPVNRPPTPFARWRKVLADLS